MRTCVANGLQEYLERDISPRELRKVLLEFYFQTVDITSDTVVNERFDSAIVLLGDGLYHIHRIIEILGKEDA